MTDTQTPEPEKKPIWTRWWMIVIYVIVGFGIIGSLAGDDTDGEPIAGEAVTTTEASDTTEPEETTTTAEATTMTTEATTTTTQPTTTSTEAPAPQPDPVEFSGSGNEVIEFDPELAGWLTETFGIFTYEVSGSGNNAVWALDADFEPTDLLVNTIGSDTGTRFISLTDDATGLEVEVSGSWTFTISPATKVFPTTTAEDFNVPLIDTTGTYPGAATEAVDWEGPAVIALKTEARIAEITATGDGNIAIWIYSSTGEADLLVNEIDQFEGSVRLPDCSEGCWLDIDGDMTYSLTLRS